MKTTQELREENAKLLAALKVILADREARNNLTVGHIAHCEKLIAKAEGRD